jgi:hypothetical protein
VNQRRRSFRRKKIMALLLTQRVWTSCELSRYINERYPELSTTERQVQYQVRDIRRRWARQGRCPGCGRPAVSTGLTVTPLIKRTVKDLYGNTDKASRVGL